MTVWPFCRSAHLRERNLTDPNPWPEKYGTRGRVKEFERDVTVITGIDESCCYVDHETVATDGTAAFHTGADIRGELDALDRESDGEFERIETKTAPFVKFNGVAIVWILCDSEIAVPNARLAGKVKVSWILDLAKLVSEREIYTRRLDVCPGERIDVDGTMLHGFSDQVVR